MSRVTRGGKKFGQWGGHFLGPRGKTKMVVPNDFLLVEKPHENQ